MAASSHYLTTSYAQTGSDVPTVPAVYAMYLLKETGDLRSFLGINIHYDREKGRLTFDVAEKIKKIFKEKEWLTDIGQYW